MRLKGYGNAIVPQQAAEFIKATGLIREKTMSIKAEQVVGAVVSTRDEIDAIKKRHKDELADLEELQEKRTKWLHKQLDEVGTDSMKTKFGTFFKEKTERVGVEDADTFYAFVKEHDAWDLLTKAVNKTSALERFGEDRDVSKVPGLKYSSEIEVQVRRS